MSSSSPVTSFNFEAKSQEPHKLWEGVFTVLQIHPQTPNALATFSRKLMLCKTLDGEIKLLRIRELDNDDVDDKPDSTDEDSPPNLSIGQRVVVQCGVDIGCIG